MRVRVASSGAHSVSRSNSTASLGLSPLDTCNSYSMENDTADDQGLKPSEKSALRENAIAASICELYDRLGGFIKS
jgi:hypothetical protein